MKKLIVTNLYKSYAKRSDSSKSLVLNNISFAIETGEILGIVGESGCGKSTLSRLIAGLEEPDSGTIEIDGELQGVISKFNLRNVQRSVQMVFQDPYSSLNPRQSIRVSLLEVVNLYNPDFDLSQKEKLVTDLLSKVGIGPELADRYPHQFSGGQRQRICIARSLAAKPSLLILDEPVSALDVSVRAEIVNLLLQLKRDFSLTYIFVSHDLDLVKHVSDHILVMFKGEIVEIGDWKEVMESPKHNYTKTLIAAAPKHLN